MGFGRYATFCSLAGCDPADAPAVRKGLPPVDSLNHWPMLSGTNLTSPRTEIPCNPMSASMQAQTGLLHEAGPVGLPGNGDAAIIIGRHKLLMYNVTQSLWQSPNYPNGTVIDTYDWKYVVECTTETKPACLFDIISVRQETWSLDLVLLAVST